jgi:hypothetical protein
MAEAAYGPIHAVVNNAYREAARARSGRTRLGQTARAMDRRAGRYWPAMMPAEDVRIVTRGVICFRYGS